LWTGTDEANWLGWLDIIAEQITQIQDLRRVVEDAIKECFTGSLERFLACQDSNLR
jgi:hypothetical protein